MTFHAWLRRLAMVGSLLIGSTLQLYSPLANAQGPNVITFSPQGPSVGDEFVYLSGNGKTWTIQYEKPGVYKHSDGSVWLKNEDGNTLKSRNRTFSPHSGYRPPGNKGQLQVGQSWSHRYSVDGVSRKRKCKIVSQEDFVGKAGVFTNAFKIKCNNRRSDRSLPMREEIWFAPYLDVELKYYGYWYGSSPGSYSYEIIEVRRSP